MASRFIDDANARTDVIALYAFNIELARVAEVAREPLAREIRLTWWDEALDEVFAGRPPRGHPIVQAVAAAVQRRALPHGPFEALIEARVREIDEPRFVDEASVHRHIDATAGALMSLAASILCAGAEPAASAARAWGLAGLARLRRGGDDRLPPAWSEGELRGRVRAALTEARAAAVSLPVAAFPAVAYAALARPYAAGRAPSELEKRARLTAAVLTGRL